MCSRRQPVASGGLLSTHKATVSKETQDLLKVMMKESQLTNFQIRQLDQKMKSGESLPLHCSPTSSAATKSPTSKTKNSKKSTNSPQKKPTGLRTHSSIIVQLERQHEMDPPSLPIRHCYNSSTEKERLQDLMAGIDKSSTQINTSERPSSIDQNLDNDRSYDEIVQEIMERQQFLEEMESLGRGKEYRHKIMTEISQRMRELELLDKK